MTYEVRTWQEGAKGRWVTIATCKSNSDARIVAEALIRQFGKAMFGFSATQVEVWANDGFHNPYRTDHMDKEGWTMWDGPDPTPSRRCNLESGYS
jgi:hypothetical protein